MPGRWPYLGSLCVAIIFLEIASFAALADTTAMSRETERPVGTALEPGGGVRDETCGLTALLDYASLYGRPVSEQGARDAARDTVLAEAVIRSIEARERVVRAEIESLEGLWNVEETALGPESSGAGEPRGGGNDEEGCGAAASLGVIENPAPSYLRQRVYLVMDGERFRESVRTIEPAREAEAYMHGYDGVLA